MWAGSPPPWSAVMTGAVAGQQCMLIYLLEPCIIKPTFHILFCQGPHPLRSMLEDISKPEARYWLGLLVTKAMNKTLLDIIFLLGNTVVQEVNFPTVQPHPDMCLFHLSLPL